ncbi:Uncharacterised protein [Segatella copri]|nr:Uncharacterised protein [Segatella copri]
MALRSITDAVYTFYDGIHRSIITDCIVCTIKVIINCSWQSDAAYIKLTCEIHRTCQRTVTANHDKRIYFLFLNRFKCLLTTFFGHEFLRTGCLQHRTTCADDTAYILCRKGFNFIIDETIVTTIDTFHSETVVDSRTGNRTDSSIHTWSISSRC